MSLQKHIKQKNKNTKNLKTTNPRIGLFNLDNSKNLKKKVPRASMEASKLKYKLWNTEIV
ncbi:hypothetical protein BB558_000893 [Smittium angustum]|uniref:Uncharacterized protein n=1 Tax=Smittium angustum TaxID=133377 RepID=A0A2U1JD85_SMIAN|nr:hypothetical protein BB558_000893 [Smittium angustum]